MKISSIGQVSYGKFKSHFGMGQAAVFKGGWVCFSHALSGVQFPSVTKTTFLGLNNLGPLDC